VYLPAILALSASDCVRQSGFSAALAKKTQQRGRGASARPRGGRAAAYGIEARQYGDTPVRRRNAARGDRACARAATQGIFNGRTAVVARRKAARRVAYRTQAPASHDRRN